MSPAEFLDILPAALVWGAVATAAMTTLMEGSQLLGLSRMSLPFLFGTFVTGNRNRAIVYGFVLYSVGALLFSLLYAACFVAIGYASWWLGGALGLLHGLFLIAVMLPLIAHVHPRMASEYSGPTTTRRLEPPGPFGLYYGHATPLITLLGQTAYGLILGLALSMHRF